jgi:hypothetical protein
MVGVEVYWKNNSQTGRKRAYLQAMVAPKLVHVLSILKELHA